MGWALDCSLALAWALPDEMSRRADRFLAYVARTSQLWVPALWWYELSNALLLAQRRHRLAETDRIRVMELFAMLPIQTDAELDANTAQRFHGLAERHGLSAYDAAYVELAERRGVGLATLDRSLATAARRVGVKVPRL